MYRRRARLAVKRAYETTAFQILIAIAIFINFLCNAVEAELLVSVYELYAWVCLPLPECVAIIFTRAREEPK